MLTALYDTGTVDSSKKDVTQRILVMTGALWPLKGAKDMVTLWGRRMWGGSSAGRGGVTPEVPWSVRESPVCGMSLCGKVRLGFPGGACSSVMEGMTPIWLEVGET